MDSLKQLSIYVAHCVVAGKFLYASDVSALKAEFRLITETLGFNLEDIVFCPPFSIQKGDLVIDIHLSEFCHNQDIR